MAISSDQTLRCDELEVDANAFYRHVLEALAHAGVPFLVGGAFAFARVTGIQRDTKDLDLFIRRDDYGRISKLMRRFAYRAQLSYAHWLAKVHCGEAFVDMIFNSGNGVLPVDEEWFSHACRAEVLGVPVMLVPVEESLCSKAFIMERERYDGADVAHLLRAWAPRMDWHRLLRRFGPHWRVLLSHLVLFGFVYPGERALVPAWLVDDLMRRLQREAARAEPGRVCAGTLLSREQYLHDVEQQGFDDGRITPFATMTPQEVSQWTAAIPGRDTR